jgi:4-diphosphocytidyl-2-C-methyl-D-erythritol kinase
MTRTFFAPAKINLWLRVFAPDASGYHPLDTLFCAIDLRDQLDVGDGPGLHLDVSGIEVGEVEDNLVYRAAHAYFECIGKSPDVQLKLQKNIPAGAGLGGGSSDAAATLIALQERNDWALPHDEMMSLAAQLGSDILSVRLAMGACTWSRRDPRTHGAVAGAHCVDRLAEFPDSDA